MSCAAQLSEAAHVGGFELLLQGPLRCIPAAEAHDIVFELLRRVSCSEDSWDAGAHAATCDRALLVLCRDGIGIGTEENGTEEESSGGSRIAPPDTVLGLPVLEELLSHKSAEVRLFVLRRVAPLLKIARWKRSGGGEAKDWEMGDSRSGGDRILHMVLNRAADSDPNVRSEGLRLCAQLLRPPSLSPRPTNANTNDGARVQRNVAALFDTLLSDVNTAALALVALGKVIPTCDGDVRDNYILPKLLDVTDAICFEDSTFSGSELEQLAETLISGYRAFVNLHFMGSLSGMNRARLVRGLATLHNSGRVEESQAEMLRLMHDEVSAESLVKLPSPPQD